MLRTLRLSEKLRRSLVKSGITGEIVAHGAKTNLGAISRLLKLDPYVTFGVEAINTAVKQKAVNQDHVEQVMAEALGTPVARFRRPGPGYIAPQLTAPKLNLMAAHIDVTIKNGGLFLLATAHPGSLLSYYSRLVHYISDKGGKVYHTPTPFQVAEYRWLDSIDGVHVLSDQGNLLHTHDSLIFSQFLDQLPNKPAVVLADHGYAGAAINAQIKTVAIHDVDDPGIALAAQLGCDVLPIPMNDNQLNLPTVTALEAVLEARRNEP